MRLTMSAVAVALLVACSSSINSPDLVVSVVSGSEAKAAFIPQALETTDTVVWLKPDAAGRTADGAVVSGFRFSSIRVSEGARVKVYALTNRAFTTRESSLKAVRIADYTVGSGSEVQIEQMSTLGVAPMSIRVQPYGSRAS